MEAGGFTEGRPPPLCSGPGSTGGPKKEEESPAPFQGSRAPSLPMPTAPLSKEALGTSPTLSQAVSKADTPSGVPGPEWAGNLDK